ncbi:hypothetical protein KQX54_010891 [Cotesia glomerata]|uniref:Uncharacterized protein n=1 Tax=Cotesia glomerata TaxID=32391 RepID=A0AAV7I1R3_COTGL|nr:hypothetical protein KQX54_010891 [Cotesia glomerata]
MYIITIYNNVGLRKIIKKLRSKIFEAVYKEQFFSGTTLLSLCEELGICIANGCVKGDTEAGKNKKSLETDLMAGGKQLPKDRRKVSSLVWKPASAEQYQELIDGAWEYMDCNENAVNWEKLKETIKEAAHNCKMTKSTGQGKRDDKPPWYNKECTLAKKQVWACLKHT